MLDLATIGTAQADDPPHFASINKRHGVQSTRVFGASDYARLVVLEPVINPPLQFYDDPKRLFAAL
jgi:hypothetical protein